MQRIREGYTVVHASRAAGMCGRIVSLREDFEAIAGYDEAMLPMGYQDCDLVIRLRAIGGAHYT
eukprot:3215802-Amphidinium_carterae.1